MKITATLGGGPCGNKWDCDEVYDTDDPEDILVRGRFTTEPVIDPATGATLRLPNHEGLLRVKRSVYYGAAS